MPEALATLFKESIVRERIDYYVISFGAELFNVQITQTHTGTHTLALC